MAGVNITAYKNNTNKGSYLLNLFDNNNINEILSYLDNNHDININEQGKFGRTALYYACRNGSLDLIQILLDKGANIELRNHHGFTPIYCASLHNQPHIIQLLHDYGGNIYKTDAGGLSPLHIAAEKGYIKVVKILLDLDKQHQYVFMKDSIGYTPYDWAILKHHSDCAELLNSSMTQFSSINC